MSIRVVRLGSPRRPREGMRIGTVRRPPRGVPKSKFAELDWYDVWFPTLAPSPASMKMALSAKTPQDFARIARKYKSEMSEPSAQHALSLLATLSRDSNFSLGCYCEDESRCHRSIIRQLLLQRGAEIE